MYAYDETYLFDAQCHIGSMIDYVVYDLKYDMEEYWQMFCSSSICKALEMGSPKYLAGMSGVELARDVIYEVTGQYLNAKPSMNIDYSAEYWAGWILARYQWERNISYKRLMELGLGVTGVIKMYVLHETDPSKFVETADAICERNAQNEENRLKRLRAYAKLTQKALSEKSGVSLRMIQLYEQGQNDLSKAQVRIVMDLAHALGCRVEELVG